MKAKNRIKYRNHEGAEVEILAGESINVRDIPEAQLAYLKQTQSLDETTKEGKPAKEGKPPRPTPSPEGVLPDESSETKG